MDADALELEIAIEASPEIVFGYFTDPDKLAQWHGVYAELEPRPGGKFRLNVTGRDVASGAFVTLEPYERIVFTWGWERPGHAIPPGLTTVDVTLTPIGSGTLVRLRHSGFPTSRSRQEHERGWRHYLGRLRVAGAGGDPGPDPWETTDAPRSPGSKPDEAMTNPARPREEH